jgi:ribosomal protein L17
MQIALMKANPLRRIADRFITEAKSNVFEQTHSSVHVAGDEHARSVGSLIAP